MPRMRMDDDERLLRIECALIAVAVAVAVNVVAAVVKLAM